jgi:5-methylcytosine-specific restriction endonuclease McrA
MVQCVRAGKARLAVRYIFWESEWLRKKEIKARLFERQRGRCANPLCNRLMVLTRPLLPESAELDHIQARSRRGRNVESNYQLLCRECNGRKCAKDSEDFKRRYAKDEGMLYMRKS